MSWIAVFLIFVFLLPSNSAWLNKTYGTLEFITPGNVIAPLTYAQLWCKQQGSTLAEITSEHIWNLYLNFVNEIGLNLKNIILNADGRTLPAWQWTNGELFRDVDSYQLGFDSEMYGCLSETGNQNLSITKSLPNCGHECNNGYVCEHPGEGSCKVTQSSDSIPLDGNCYVFHHDKRVSWFEAFYECEKNNGRLATFKNIKNDEASIAQQLEHGKKYWIGLYKYKWRWADSKELLGFSNWGKTYPHRAQSCVYVYFPTNQWHTYDCRYSHNFVCLRDVTKCVSNPCRNNATCSYVDNNSTCQCAPGFTGSHCETKHANDCGDNPCQNGATCFDSEKDYICLCAPGSRGLECQTGSSYTLEPSVSDITMKLIIVLVVIATVFLILLALLVCVKKKITTRKSNDAELASRYETRNTSAMDNHIYSDIKGYVNIGADVNQRAGQESSIYEQVD